jgi:uroporphyrinogen-III synthase
MRRHILVTRPSGQARTLCDRLETAGFVPVAVPTVEIDSVSAASLLDGMLASLDDAAWLVITSANGADALGTRLRATGRRLPPQLKVAAVGPGTAERLVAADVRVDHVPDRYLTVEIASGLGEVAGRRVILARADAATPDLRLALLDAGAVVEEVIAYRTIEGPASSRDALCTALRHELHGITFTSSSTVRGLLRLVSPTDRLRARALPAFCIGPVTAETANRAGFDVALVASEHTTAGLAAAIADHFSEDHR